MKPTIEWVDYQCVCHNWQLHNNAIVFFKRPCTKIDSMQTVYAHQLQIYAMKYIK